VSDRGDTLLNFDLLIEKDGSQYRSRVTDSPCGEATSTFAPPLQPLEAAHMRLMVVRSRSVVRSIDSSAATLVRDIGERLFRGAFSGEVEKCYTSSVQIADQRNVGLRIRLRLDDPDVAQLPWEYLRDPSSGGNFLGLDLDTPLVRYMQIARPAKRLRVDGPLKVLAVISTPKGREGIDATREWANLQLALDPLLKRGLVSLRQLETPSFAALEAELGRNDYHIFHFVGHGGYDEQARDGVLVFTDPDGSESWVTSDQLGPILGDQRTLQLAVLNACEGAISEGKDLFAGCAQRLVARGVPAVIAMQAEITDQAAIDFSQRFYEALAGGRPVDEALIRGRKAIFSAPNQLEWGTPVLYMRSGDGKLFDVSAENPAVVEDAAPRVAAVRATVAIETPAKPQVPPLTEVRTSTPRTSTSLTLLPRALLIGGAVLLALAFLGQFMGSGITAQEARSLIDRVERDLWVRAMLTLDTSTYACCVGGAYAAELDTDIANLRANRQARVVRNYAFEYLGDPVPLPDGRVQQSTREAWSWDVVSGGVIVDQQPELTVVRHYTIARIDGVLRIVEHSFE
jgi:hypothetical protein